MDGVEPDPDYAVVTAQLGRILVFAGEEAEAMPLIEEAFELAATSS